MTTDLETAAHAALEALREAEGELYQAPPADFEQVRVLGVVRAARAALEAALAVKGTIKVGSKFALGDRVRKTKGSSWQGIVVGTYSTSMTPEGYAVESEREPGSVQIYPAAALDAALAVKGTIKVGSNSDDPAAIRALAKKEPTDG